MYWRWYKALTKNDTLQQCYIHGISIFETSVELYTSTQYILWLANFAYFIAVYSKTNPLSQSLLVYLFFFFFWICREFLSWWTTVPLSKVFGILIEMVISIVIWNNIKIKLDLYTIYVEYTYYVKIALYLEWNCNFAKYKKCPTV